MFAFFAAHQADVFRDADYADLSGARPVKPEGATGRSAGSQRSNVRSMTAAFSADPERKYRAAVSREACPRRAWTWAESAPPWRRRVPKVWRQRWGTQFRGYRRRRPRWCRPPRPDHVQLGGGAHHGRDRGAEELAEVDMPVTHHRQLPRRHPGDVRGGLALADVDPPVNTVTQYRPSGSQLLGSEPGAGPKWWCQPSQQVVRATTGNCDGSGIRRAIAPPPSPQPAVFPRRGAACGPPRHGGYHSHLRGVP